MQALRARINLEWLNLIDWVSSISAVSHFSTVVNKVLRVTQGRHHTRVFRWNT